MKVLQVIGSLNRGGAETFVMNLLRNIDGRKYQFIFLCYGNDHFDYEDEAVSLGAKIVRLPSLKKSNPFSHVIGMVKILRSESVDIVHVHTYYNSMFALLASWLCGVKMRITHSHNTQSEATPSFFKRVYFRASSMFIDIFSTVRLACGDAAGVALFGKKAGFTVVNNAINLDDFKYEPTVRLRVREQLGISDSTTVLMHVGRFELVKNHDLLVDVYGEYRSLKPDSILLLVGRGPLEDDIKKKVDQLGLSDNVRFLGVRSDVKDLYNVADVFIFPSLFEGLPVALVEAQANGLTVLASETIDQSVKLIESFSFYSIEQSPKKWAKLLSQLVLSRYDSYKTLINGPYDIASTVKSIESLYSSGERL